MVFDKNPKSGATTRRAFLGAGAVAAATLPSQAAWSSAPVKSSAPRQSRLILLGTGGGPTPRKTVPRPPKRSS